MEGFEDLENQILSRGNTQTRGASVTSHDEEVATAEID
jgi:hypothetical protein